MAMNPDELVPPPWMDKAFFERVIRHHEKDPKTEIHDFVITPGSKMGDHFASIMFRCVMNYSSKFQKNAKISLIVKAMPHEEGAKKDLLEEAPLFKTEMRMYGEILPEIMSLLKSTGDDCKLGPKLIFQTTEPSSVIVLEDVSVDGYKVIVDAPKKYEDTQAIFQRLAKYHAATYYLMHEKHADFSELDYTIYKAKNNPVMDKFLTETLVLFADDLETWPGYEVYVPKLRKFIEEFMDLAVKAYSANKPGDGFNVLNHGDFHIKNLLFKQDAEENLEDMYFIDFQICVLASPAVDLNYALLNAISKENCINLRGEIIHYYHQEFEKALKSFGFLKQIPTLLDVQIELLKTGCLEVIMSIAFSLFSYLDPTQLDFTELLVGDSVALKQKLFKNPEFQKYMERQLPKFLHNGFI